MLFLADSSLFRKRAEKTEVEELQVGMMGMILGGVMTFRRYESNRCQEEVIRSKTTYMIYTCSIYIYNIHMGTGKNSEVPGELLNFLLIDCYILAPPTQHTHIYTVCAYTHSHTYIIDVSIYLSDVGH